jgi:serine acetyltransferase
MDINKLIKYQHSLFIKNTFFSKTISKIIYRYLRIRYQCDIPYTCSLHNVYLCHQGFGIVINPKSKIGSGTYIQHGVTIGINEETLEAPVIGNNVKIGARSLIIGGVTVGDNAVIGAGSVVVRDVPSNSTVVGVPAKVIKINGNKV